MNQEIDEWDNVWGESWVGEPPADYTNDTKGQFLDTLEHRLKLFMVRAVKVCRSLPKDYDAQHFGINLFVHLHQRQPTFGLSEEAEVVKNILQNLVFR